jgi:predicted transcriptional regulator
VKPLIDHNQRKAVIEEGLKNGKTLTSIGKTLGMSISGISRYCKRYNIQTPINDRYQYDDKKIKELLKQNIPLLKISEQLKIPYNNLYAYCKKKDYDFCGKGRYKNPVYDKVSILLKEGKTLPFISKKLNIPYINLYSYCRRNNISFNRHSRHRVYKKSDVSISTKPFDHGLVKILIEEGIKEDRSLSSIAKEVNISCLSLGRFCSKTYGLRYSTLKQVFECCKEHKFAFKGEIESDTTAIISKLLHMGFSQVEISNLTGISLYAFRNYKIKEAVNKLRSQSELRARKVRDYRDKIVKMIRENDSAGWIANELNFSQSSISNFIKKDKNLKLLYKLRPKTTIADKIKELAENMNFTRNEIANILGFSYGSVTNYVRSYNINVPKPKIKSKKSESKKSESKRNLEWWQKGSPIKVPFDY